MTEQVNVILCPYLAASHHCNCSIIIIVVIVAIAVTVVIVIVADTNTVTATAPLISSLSHCCVHQEYQSSLKPRIPVVIINEITISYFPARLHCK